MGPRVQIEASKVSEKTLASNQQEKTYVKEKENTHYE
jgi:hypothetical protein